MFKLPSLPYAEDALQPVISAETMRLHHDKHHAKYVETTNILCRDEGLMPDSLEELVAAARTSNRRKLFNNAAQAWNHAFFWSCMTPRSKAPDGELAQAITTAFGGMDALQKTFLAEGETHFGSGWVWLLAGNGGLTVRSTHDGDDFLGRVGPEAEVPLMVCDLWEHAYYVDYRNERPRYLKAWFEQLVDWEFAGHQLAAARGPGEPWRYPAPEKGEARRQA